MVDKMTTENTKYDDTAKTLYSLHRPWGQPAFFNLKLKDRDYWRALAQEAREESLYPGLDRLDLTAVPAKR